MKFLDAEDRAALNRVIDQAVGTAAIGVGRICMAVIGVLLLASVAGLAVQAFRFTSGW